MQPSVETKMGAVRGVLNIAEDSERPNAGFFFPVRTWRTVSIWMGIEVAMVSCDAILTSTALGAKTSEPIFAREVLGLK